MALFNRKSLFVLVMLVGLVFTLGTVMAHEGREVGEYELVFGWRNEPALVGYPNGPEILIRLHGAEEADHVEGDDHNETEHEDPLADLVVSLQVEVAFGPATRTLELRPAFGETGHYIADLIPTRPGDYTFRVFGTIGDLEVDEVFTSADGSFSSVEPASDITFPDEIPSFVELLERIAELEAQVEALQGE